MSAARVEVESGDEGGMIVNLAERADDHASESGRTTRSGGRSDGGQSSEVMMVEPAPVREGEEFISFLQ
jgi:hypothetical protein